MGESHQLEHDNWRDKNIGMVTVETALSLIVVILFFLFLCGFIVACITKIKAVDMAREAARSAARGQDYAREQGPATVTVHDEGDLVHAETEITITVALLHIRIHAESYAAKELVDR